MMMAPRLERSRSYLLEPVQARRSTEGADADVDDDSELMPHIVTLLATEQAAIQRIASAQEQDEEEEELAQIF